MATTKTIDPNNFNAWRKKIKPDAQDYEFGVDANKDKQAYDWGVKNGYNDAESYIQAQEAPAPAPEPEVQAPKTPQELAQEAASTGKSYLQLYQENFPKPEYDQQKAGNVQKAKNLSIIADIIKTVGEGVTTPKGGQPIQRQSAAPALNAELTRLNEVYKQEAKAYKQGGFNAILQDARSDESKKRQEAILKSQAIRDAQNLKKWELEYLQKNDKAGKDEAYRAAKMKLDEQRFKETTSIARERNAISRSKGNGSSSKDDEKFKYIIVNGKSVQVPVSYITDVAAKEMQAKEKNADFTNMTPEQLFSQGWNRHYNYVNGQFVPKSQSTPYQPKPGQYRETQGVNAGKWVESYKNKQAREANKPKSTQAQKTKSDPLGLGI